MLNALKTIIYALCAALFFSAFAPPLAWFCLLFALGYSVYAIGVIIYFFLACIIEVAIIFLTNHSERPIERH